MADFEEQRRKLVKSMRLHNKAVEKAFLAVNRQEFFLPAMTHHSYVDSAFPIGFGQTISQPITIAIMLEMLDVRPGNSVLEVGSGSGYVLALLSKLAGEKGKVYGVELLHELEQKAKKKLLELGYKNVFMRCGDGTLGWKEKAKFDRILVSAACKQIPKPLTEQLGEKGKVVAPVGSRLYSEIVLFEKEKGKLVERERKCCFAFVPLKGKFS